ncbi:MAG: excinuclease ABC subunit UvrA [Paludibacter sp.]|nr:excinuclease ABC subunit UvrA [Bacteroidales bacterium]MCM1068890.1 excinuclease ABC subunit UvrA [Prevotella sp.]MCM1353151.1 excinuclease ABC subunit UvrA [Bacteroides sp.]MCM1442473.1 excinuclease ABC subunit UvrA [Muribaculum sp.]MCM1481316.1 excinuclease ABC subunit UvrA [Paludibacter sp.]
MNNGQIHIKGARTHNLKNIDVTIPRNKLVVITGLSGSGKSSLAFDTLYAEGQRRYVESLSAYARQFLGRMQKPEVDIIDGIPPAIAIEQKTLAKNPRSTVGTSTEIYDYLKLLFARIGHTLSPLSGTEVKRHQVSDVVDYAMQQPNGTRIMLLAPISETDRTLKERCEIWEQQGFSRLVKGSEVLRISDCPFDQLTDELYLLIDRIVADGEQSTANRFADSVQTAFFEGQGYCTLLIDSKHYNFSVLFEADGLTFIEPTEHLFDFNNPLGACPVCNGFGNIIGIDPDLVVPNKSLSIYQGAIACWRGEKMGLWNQQLIDTASLFDFPVHTPFYELTQAQKQLIWTGNQYFKGLNDFFAMLEEQQYAKIQYRVMLARYRGKTLCPECHGGRLRKEASYVRINGCSITDLTNLSINDLHQWFAALQLPQHEQLIAKQLLQEINSRLQFMQDVGLGYLTLNRLAGTLSGGESQRINLAKSLGSSLVGSLYILDEPSIGLHPRDTAQLIKVMKELRDIGNTVVVVEHDEDIMRAADYIIDVGPEAGINGGQIVWQGHTGQEFPTPALHSYTLDFLTGKEQIDIPRFRRPWNNYIKLTHICENNLKNIDVLFPLNVMTVVTGVSGSGKSSLVSKVLYPALKKYYGGVAEHTGDFGELEGSMHLLSDIEYVDQNPIGTSTRSNPVTYIKAYDEIRKLFAEQPLSYQMGYTAAHFSFNTPGGRCEECKGEGTTTIEMQFMANLVLECEHCHGKRFKQDVLEVEYRGKNIYDVLEMTVNQAINFFSEGKGNTEKKIVKRLKPLQDVGIGYIKLGQPSSTLSGGENQRVKLASFLANEKYSPTLFVFDEPTTGLHYHDINVLLCAMNALIANGHTVVVIEHNPAVIMAADHIIDLGPEGGQEGGQIVFTGTPEMLLKCGNSYTGKFLAANNRIEIQ